MRNGLKIYDTDTHFRITAETLQPHLSTKILNEIPNISDYYEPIKVGYAGDVRKEPYRHVYRFTPHAGWSRSKPRQLGEAEARDEKRRPQTFMGVTPPTAGSDDYDAEGRLNDMDKEGVDVHFIVHFGGTNHPDPTIETEFTWAQHRHLHDFCSHNPRRLKSCLSVTPHSIDGSIREIRRWGKEPWAVAVHPKLPLNYPLDHPDMHPIWAAAQEHGLAVIHHSLSTGYPGYRDMWDNPFIGRCGSHPWAAMRAVCAFIGSGLFDKFPDLRYGVMESGFSWLPFWARRMDDQATYVGYVADLKKKMSEYLSDGRFFCSVERHEGADMAKMVNDFLGDHVLMFGSDYPHPESHFPKSAEHVLAWRDVIGEEATRKMMWDNPVRLFGEP